MIYFNTNKKFNKTDSICFVTDFDRTITTQDSPSSIGIFRKIFSKRYSYELDNIREIIINDLIMTPQEKTRMFAIEELKILSKFLKKEYIPKDIASYFTIREGFEAFINLINETNQTLFINSSGIGNIIELVLRYNNFNLEKSNIIANNYNENFDFDFSKLVYSKAKYTEEYLEKIKKYENFVIIGDSHTDVTMVPYDDVNKIKIGFLKENLPSIFDVVAINPKFYSDPIERILK